jgi:Na+-driven multidrug efflux pump
MFNVRYNILAIYQVVLGLLNSLLLLKVFGVSSKADAYLIGSNVMGSLQFVHSMCIEQFLFVYHDLKVMDRQSAKDFYQTAVSFSLISGVFFCLLYILAIDPLISLFAFGIDAERYQLLRKVLHIMFIGVVFDSVNFINMRLLQAEMKFSIPYVLTSLQALLTTLLLGYLVVTGNTSIELIAGARTAGICVVFLAGLVVVRRIGFPFRFRLRHPSLRSFVRNSITMRLGQNIHNFLINPITNNILALLPTGYASYFYYAQRLHTINNNIVIGPSYTVLNSRVSIHWAGKNLAGIKADIRKFLPPAVLTFMVTTTFAVFLIPTAFRVVGSRHLSQHDIQYIQHLFLALAPWYLIGLVESPFISVCLASKRSMVFIATNSFFIVAYFSLSILMTPQFGIYTIPIAMASAQLINLTAFTVFALTLLKEKG